MKQYPYQKVCIILAGLSDRNRSALSEAISKRFNADIMRLDTPVVNMVASVMGKDAFNVRGDRDLMALVTEIMNTPAARKPLSTYLGSKLQEEPIFVVVEDAVTPEEVADLTETLEHADWVVSVWDVGGYQGTADATVNVEDEVPTLMDAAGLLFQSHIADRLLKRGHPRTSTARPGSEPPPHRGVRRVNPLSEQRQ
jgi:hypothetical protein